MLTGAQVKERAQDILRSINSNSNIYSESYKRGMSLSSYLEEEMPEEEYKDGMTAYQRLLRCAGIRVNSVLEDGIYAHTWEDFVNHPQARALAPEFLARQYRKVIHSLQSQRSLYTSQDQIPGSLAKPWSDNQRPRWDSQVAPAIPLSELIAFTTPIDNDAYRTFYLTTNAGQSRKRRVAEGSEIPRLKLQAGEHTLRLSKFGAAIEVTYEELRRQRIDRVGQHIQRMAVQSEIDKVSAAIDIMVNGDGNTGTTPTTYNLTTLDSGATAGTLTLKAWIAFKMKFANPYVCMLALTQEAVALQLSLLNSGSANIPLAFLPTSVNIGSLEPINPGLSDGVRLGWTTDAPTLKIIGVDKRFAIERVFEIGSDIQEVERFVLRQTQVLTMTEVEAYATVDANAIRLLNVNA